MKELSLEKGWLLFFYGLGGVFLAVGMDLRFNVPMHQGRLNYSGGFRNDGIDFVRDDTFDIRIDGDKLDFAKVLAFLMGKFQPENAKKLVERSKKQAIEKIIQERGKISQEELEQLENKARRNIQRIESHKDDYPKVLRKQFSDLSRSNKLLNLIRDRVSTLDYIDIPKNKRDIRTELENLRRVNEFFNSERVVPTYIGHFLKLGSLPLLRMALGGGKPLDRRMDAVVNFALPRVDEESLKAFVDAAGSFTGDFRMNEIDFYNLFKKRPSLGDAYIKKARLDKMRRTLNPEPVSEALNLIPKIMAVSVLSKSDSFHPSRKRILQLLTSSPAEVRNIMEQTGVLDSDGTYIPDEHMAFLTKNNWSGATRLGIEPEKVYIVGMDDAYRGDYQSVAEKIFQKSLTERLEPSKVINDAVSGNAMVNPTLMGAYDSIKARPKITK